MEPKGGRRVPIAPTVAAVLGVVAFGARPVRLVEGYLEHVYPAIVSVTGPVFRLLPLPSIELLGLVAALAAVAFVGLRLVRVLRKREEARAAFGRVARAGVGLASVAFALAVLFGFAFTIRVPVEERVGLDLRSLTASDLEAAATRLDAAVVEARRALGPVPTIHAVPAGDWLDGLAGDRFPFDRARVIAAAREAATTAVALLESRTFAIYQLPREPFPRSLFHQYGCWGRSNPILGEVTISRFISAIDYVAVLPHEYAHATGIVRERDACFYAFVGGVRSSDPLLRYSVLVDARRHLLDMAVALGETDARTRADALLPNDVAFEIVERERLTSDLAFAPGATIEVLPAADAPPTVAVTPGEPQGHAGVAAYAAVSKAAGVPMDYSSANALIAAWVLGGR